MWDVWFDANHWGCLPGVALALAGVLAGALTSARPLRGKSRALALGVVIVALLLSVGLLAAGGLAWFFAQPFRVWYALTLPGMLGVMIFSYGLALVRGRHASEAPGGVRYT